MYWDMGSLYNGSIYTFVYPQMGFVPMPADLAAEEKKFYEKLAFLDEHLIKVLTFVSVKITDLTL